MLSDTLTRQRIKYLLEYGGIYPAEEPATKNFVIKVAAILVLTQIFEIICEVLLLRW